MMARIASIGPGGKTIPRGRAQATTQSQSKVDKRHQIGSTDWVNTGKWVRVKSSNVAGIAYHRKNKNMYVEFLNGAVYEYKGVAVDTARAMFNSGSMGKFVHRRLKGKYPFSRIK